MADLLRVVNKAQTDFFQHPQITYQNEIATEITLCSLKRLEVACGLNLRV